MKEEINLKRELYMHYNDVTTTKLISDTLITYLPTSLVPIVVLCIGTDRSTGDSLGPLTGTLLTKMNPRQLIVQGTLHDPVHAINLSERIDHIQNSFYHPYIIAVDASLGKSNSIGQIITHNSSILPGAALKKDLPPVGDAYVTGVVNIGGIMDYAVLQSTRLSVVHDMATVLATILYQTDRWLHLYQQNKKKLI